MEDDMEDSQPPSGDGSQYPAAFQAGPDANFDTNPPTLEPQTIFDVEADAEIWLNMNIEGMLPFAAPNSCMLL